MPRPNDKIGPYTLIEPLGRGGFGIVWLAERRGAIITTKVAIKLPNDYDVDIDAVKKEAVVWAHAAGHPNILPIIDADIYEEQVVIVSEYASEGSLSNWLKRHGGKAPSIEAAVRMIDGILAGLEHLHEQQIIHRDLKPDNILLQRGIPRLADFGIARLLKTTSPKYSMASGTYPYMAPEAYRGKRSEQTDIWSVGVIFYELLAGHWPFQGDPPTMMFNILTQEPPPLQDSIPASVKRVIAKALQKDEMLRYASTTEMRKELISLASSLPSTSVDEIKTEVLTATSSEETFAAVSEETLVPTYFEGAREFVGDDEAYLRWAREHPDGFVINTARSTNPNYMVLHRTACSHISTLEPSLKGGFTERGYIKICSDEVAALREWAKQHGRADGSFSNECTSCKPLSSNANTTPTKQLQLEYWTELVKYLRNKNSFVHLNAPKPEYSITGSLGHPQVELVATANTRDGRICVGVWIRGRKDIFRALERDKDTIEREISWRDPNKRQDFLWLENEHQTISDIWLRWHGPNLRQRERWLEYLEWHRQKLESFFKTFESRVRKFAEWLPPTPNTTWHRFIAGNSYRVDEIVSECLEHISSGKVEDPDEKFQLLEIIENCGHPVLVFTPQGTGWGASPMNPNSWRTSIGHPISGKAGLDSRLEGTVSIDDPVVAININQQFPHVRNAEDLYNSTRGIWRVSRQRAERAKYAFSVYQGVIREVYEIDKWIAASPQTREYWNEREAEQGKEFPPEVHEGRSEFIGKLAPEAIRRKYVGKRMPVRHGQNPIRYFNC